MGWAAAGALAKRTLLATGALIAVLVRRVRRAPESTVERPEESSMSDRETTAIGVGPRKGRRWTASRPRSFLTELSSRASRSASQRST